MHGKVTMFTPNLSHLEAVEEVMVYMRESLPLQHPFESSDGVFEQLQLIKDYSWKNISRYRMAELDNALCGRSWIDILADSDKMSGYDFGPSVDFGELYLKYMVPIDDASNCFHTRIDQLFVKNVGADISDCAQAAARNRFLIGIDPDSFFEKCFKTIQAGGLPCGTIGTYPDCAIVVYSPFA
jgi:hypothetical protein